FSDETAKYEELLIRNIEQEFDHNLTQQIYLTSECWNLVTATKNATIHVIRQSAMHEKNASANKMRESLLRNFMEEVTPSQKALIYVRKEVSELF
ncbi:MAG: hypothetical protein ACJAUR_001171, partial [Ulvibacter sp.]